MTGDSWLESSFFKWDAKNTQIRPITANSINGFPPTHFLGFWKWTDESLQRHKRYQVIYPPTWETLERRWHLGVTGASRVGVWFADFHVSPVTCEECLWFKRGGAKGSPRSTVRGHTAAFLSWCLNLSVNDAVKTQMGPLTHLIVSSSGWLPFFHCCLVLHSSLTIIYTTSSS